MQRVLILFAHPHFEKSRVNRALLQVLRDSDAVTVHDLYELYPYFNIDVAAEKACLLEHDIIVWHHPIYMYSAPAILKQWMDMVLEFGWAHGAGGDFLQDKTALNVVSTGGTRESYLPEGFNRYSLAEFLRPFEQTARLCKMNYLPPFAVQGTYRLSDAELSRSAEDYGRLLHRLSQGNLDLRTLQTHDLLNDWLDAAPGGPIP
ncbi:MAG: NAD(P)H-dependent oxidoreductase [Syntrophaceae bacterium]